MVDGPKAHLKREGRVGKHTTLDSWWLEGTLKRRHGWKTRYLRCEGSKAHSKRRQG